MGSVVEVFQLLLQILDAILPGGAHETVIRAAGQHFPGGAQLQGEALALRGKGLPAVGTAFCDDVPGVGLGVARGHSVELVFFLSPFIDVQEGAGYGFAQEAEEDGLPAVAGEEAIGELDACEDFGHGLLALLPAKIKRAYAKVWLK